MATKVIAKESAALIATILCARLTLNKLMARSFGDLAAARQLAQDTIPKEWHTAPMRKNLTALISKAGVCRREKTAAFQKNTAT
jgi:hypothetical protein